MAKIFTIADGLENLGAMKTGGQGSVYKGRRTQKVITAIKLLPTPIHNESIEDKNYRDFQNEVEKLKKVNEEHNPNIVTILSSGITDTGNFPFIEMEYIDGPDLSELLHPPHEKIFTIEEVIKVATQLSSALAHCHRLNVKHGDIKSNNVKYNTQTGNYVLLDFGLSIMSHEERRSSLRHAGAIEFMAPEQNEGSLFFQTDVYSFGVVLYELLTGAVPFPLNEKGETARNKVRLAHIEKQPADVALQRKMAVSNTSWSSAQKEKEAILPNWLSALVMRCLNKNIDDRFDSGMVLHNVIVKESTALAVTSNTDFISEPAVVVSSTAENELKKKLNDYQLLLQEKENDLDELKAVLRRKDDELSVIANTGRTNNQTVKPKSPAPIILLAVLIALAAGAFATYSFMKTPDEVKILSNQTPQQDNEVDNKEKADTPIDEPGAEIDTRQDTPKNVAEVIVKPSAKETRNDTKANDKTDTTKDPVTDDDVVVTKQDPVEETKPVEQPPIVKPKANKVSLYTVNNKAFFHDSPNENSRRDAFIVHWNNAVLAALNDENNFIYVVYTNKEGQTSKGWLRKSDLNKVN